MISSTISFRKYLICFFCISGSLLFIFTLVTENLVRTKVVPNDPIIKKLAIFQQSTDQNIVFGDSHAGNGFTGGKGWVNIAQPGEQPLTTMIKAVNYFKRVKPRYVIVEADPEYINRANKENLNAFVYKSTIKIKNRRGLWILDPMYRKYLFKFWRTYINNHNFKAKNVYTKTGWLYAANMPTWTKLPPYLRVTIAKNDLYKKFPQFEDDMIMKQINSDNIKGRSQDTFNELVSYMSSKTPHVCLVQFPSSIEANNLLSKKPFYKILVKKTKLLAKDLGINYVDMRYIFDKHQEYFSDKDHLNAKGAIAFSPIITKACFNIELKDYGSLRQMII